MLSDSEKRFVKSARVGHLASSTPSGTPHIVPVCFDLVCGDVFIGLDAKPKSVDAMKLKRVRNIVSNPKTAFMVDRYDEDWNRLGYVLVTADATLLLGEKERCRAVDALRRKYVQYTQLLPDDARVIRLRPVRVTSWGDLSPWERPN